MIRLKDVVKANKNSQIADWCLKCDLINTKLGHYEIYGRNTSTYRLNKFANFVAGTIGRDPSFRGDFVALSYVWGDPTGTHDIEIDGRKCQIGKNLYEALLSIRLHTTFRVIWCDAICINQKDDWEKSWQVQQMGAIYARARATVSWLGPSSRDSDLAMQALNKLGRRCSTQKYAEIAIALEGESSVRHERRLATGILAKRGPTVDVSRLVKRWSKDFDACVAPTR